MSNTQAAHEACMIFPTAEAYREAADGYFERCNAVRYLYDEAGLCLWLSDHNDSGRTVSLQVLRDWYDGKHCPHLQAEVQKDYLRIQSQIATDPRYQEKQMVTKAIFLQKQPRLGGYQDKTESRTETKVTIVHGESMDESDFK